MCILQKILFFHIFDGSFLFSVNVIQLSNHKDDVAEVCDNMG